MQASLRGMSKEELSALAVRADKRGGTARVDANELGRARVGIGR